MHSAHMPCFYATCELSSVGRQCHYLYGDYQCAVIFIVCVLAYQSMNQSIYIAQRHNVS